MSWPLSTQSVGACLFVGGTPLGFVQDVGIGQNTEFPPSPNTVNSCAKQRTGSSDVLPHPPPPSSSSVSAQFADPSNLAHIGLRSVEFGCRAVRRIFGRRGGLGFAARPPGCSRCCLSDSAVQHRERGGALVPHHPSQPTLHVIKPHSRRSSCAPGGCGAECAPSLTRRKFEQLNT